VGVRELHDRLSRYVQHVMDGGEVVVTMRGGRVARLVPVGEVDPLADLRARGLVREPTAARSPRDRPAPRQRHCLSPALVTRADVACLSAGL
jgi:prevent-host-death family protein